MANIILFNKPYHCLSQFTDNQGRKTLADYIDYKGYYAAGRLDYDSEGLLVLTNDGKLQAKIADPQYKLPKTYLAQVEGQITKPALSMLRSGVMLNDGITLPASAQKTPYPKNMWPRTPPIRQRQNSPTTWVKLTITEGRNRQVRRMLAAVGLPCLRLIRIAVGDWHIQTMQPGEYRLLQVKSH